MFKPITDAQKISAFKDFHVEYDDANDILKVWQTKYAPIAIRKEFNFKAETFEVESTAGRDRHFTSKSEFNDLNFESVREARQQVQVITAGM